MRLTLDLLQQAHQSLNAAEQRQLLLRGFKIPAIENLGGTNDNYECIDLSDNDLIKIGNFPPLKRLHTLMLTNNRISRIAEDCFEPLPNLISITLTGNKLEKLVDLEPLTRLKNLERLSLLDNPVTKVKHFRPYMINKCSKTLRILDFNRIKDKERKAAGLLFAGERGRKLLEEIAPPRTSGNEPAKAEAQAARVGPTPEVIERIKKAIAEAETIEEVTRLERALKSGVLPEDLRAPTPTPEVADAPEPKTLPPPTAAALEAVPSKAAPPAAPVFTKPVKKVEDVEVVKEDDEPAKKKAKGVEVQIDDEKPKAVDLVDSDDDMAEKKPEAAKETDKVEVVADKKEEDKKEEDKKEEDKKEEDKKEGDKKEGADDKKEEKKDEAKPMEVESDEDLE